MEQLIFSGWVHPDMQEQLADMADATFRINITPGKIAGEHSKVTFIRIESDIVTRPSSIRAHSWEYLQALYNHYGEHAFQLHTGIAKDIQWKMQIQCPAALVKRCQSLGIMETWLPSPHVRVARFTKKIA